MSVCYGSIAKRFHDSAVSQSGVNIKQPLSVQSKRRDRRRVTLLCVVLVVVFSVCWLLFHVVKITKLTAYINLPVSRVEEILLWQNTSSEKM